MQCNRNGAQEEFSSKMLKFLKEGWQLKISLLDEYFAIVKIEFLKQKHSIATVSVGIILEQNSTYIPYIALLPHVLTVY